MSNQICDTIFVMDPQFNVIGILSNNGAFPNAPFFDDIYIQELATGAETYEFSTHSNSITSEILQLGNYIVFKYGDKYKLFQIMDNDDEHKESQIITCYCEMAGLELLTDYCEPFSIEGNVELFFNTVLQDTNWSLGGYSSSLVTNIQQVKNEKYANVYKIIQDNIETYGNIEIEFRVDFNGNTVTGFYIDVYENGYRGSKTYKRFEYGENVEGIKRNRNMYDFASAMIGTGKDGLTFKDIEWKKADGKPADKPKGQDFIVDLGANERFNKRGKYIKSLYESDDNNPQDLLLHSWERLQEVKEPKFDYEVDLALTDTEFEEISIGDTNYVIDNDYNPPILLECRVGKLEISLTDNSKNKCTLSNYKEVTSKIREPKDGENGKTPEIGDNGNWWIGGFDTNKPSQGQQGLPGPAGEPAKYVRVNSEQVFKYANGFAGSPTPSVITINSSVIGVTNPSRVWSYKTPSMSNYVSMSSTDANIVIMHNDVIWGGSKSITIRCSVGDKYDEITLVKVADGSQGIQGNGVKSTQEEFYLSSDKVNQPSETDSNWTTTCPQWKPGKYIWTRIKMTYTNNNVEYVGYSVDTSWEAVNELQISDRNFILKSDMYIENGRDITTCSISDDFIARYNESKGKKIITSLEITADNAISTNTSGSKRVGVETNVEFTDGTYGYIGCWQQLSDVPFSCDKKRISYEQIVSSKDIKRIVGIGLYIQGLTSGTVKIGKPKTQISDKVTDWNLAPEDNVTGVDVMFYLSTSNTELIGGTWQTTAPEWTEGKYMWQKTVTTLGNGHTKETNPTCIAGAKGDSGYTIVLSNENHAFPCQWNGNIPSAITTTTKVVALKGTKEITPTIGTLPTIPGLTLNKSGATITIVANVGTNLSDYGMFDIPITVDGIGFTKTFTWTKSKAGTNGSNGSNGISPLNATLSGQSLMKYLDKTTAPTPATISIKCKAMKGATEVTGTCTYQWQAYYNDAWNNIGTGSSISIAYNSSYFLNLDILQIRVSITYSNETITLEHTISKVYDNKYISQQEIFDKLTENGNDFIYTDPDTGKIYIDVTYARTGQLVADLIKGGVLTLGGMGDNSISDYGVFRILDYDGLNELARFDGGDAWFQSLSASEINTDKLIVNDIEASGITKQLTSNVSVSVNSSTGNDDSIFEDGAIFASMQGALDACPKNLGGKMVSITLETNTTEDVYFDFFYGGRMRIFFNGKKLYGFLRGNRCTHHFQFFGGTADDYYASTGKVMPNKGYAHASISTSVSLTACSDCAMYNMNIYAATNLADDCTESVGLCCGDGGYVYLNGVTPINCMHGFRANANGVLYSTGTGGKGSKYGFTAVSGGQVRLSNGKHTGGVTANTYESSGATVKYHSATFEGTATGGNNDSKPTPTTYKVSYTSNYGDTYRSSVYNSWKKDNTVRQGDYGYGDCNGAWFFSSNFAELKGKTVTKVTIKVSRTSGGTSSSVTHTLKAHKNSSRPGGMPDYIDGFSQSFGLSVGASTTVTITNSTVLKAISDGVCKGFGLRSAYDKSHYSVCKGSATVTIWYQ
ncbi:phage tail spike protein [Terrisporobacter glycolicus]|uniref:Tail spike domain-containing protein n=1 Tax=Terrisporobacter glycolicus ATCC 14880 = DSM 1288 TaxID=1121315 RepID=A0ABZ2EW08_9FIRM|nr:phage tail spike protein [Terrisporobacter glycolicus]